MAGVQATVLQVFPEHRRAIGLKATKVKIRTSDDQGRWFEVTFKRVNGVIIVADRYSPDDPEKERKIPAEHLNAARKTAMAIFRE